MTQPVIVIAPHPDDELLGAAGLLARAQANGARIAVIFVTDGGASDPAVSTEVQQTRRRREACNGLIAMLGSLPPVLFLDREDGQFDAREVDLDEVSEIGIFLSRLPQARLLVTDPSDAHPDHKAAFGLASRIASAGLVDKLEVMPISQRVDGAFGPLGYTRHPLGPLAGRKARALACHRSQIDSDGGFVLTPSVRADFATTEYTRRVHDRSIDRVTTEAVPAAHFEALFERSSDPWGYDSVAYEADRFRRTVAALGDRRFGHALELGCANGALTARIAPHCDAIVATDVSRAALAAARKRLVDNPHVEFRHGSLPADLPDGRFDLILVSDMLYYLGLAGVAQMMAMLPARAGSDCRLVMTNFLGETDCVLTGEMAAEIAIAHLPGWSRIAADRTDLLRIDVFARR